MALSKNVIPNAIPASVRTQGTPLAQDARLSRSSAPGAPRPFLVPGSNVSSPQNPKLLARVDAIAMSAIRARALRLPQEPEDAKLTGVTRSLNRRLLGLNLGGSLMRPA